MPLLVQRFSEWVLAWVTLEAHSLVHPNDTRTHGASGAWGPLKSPCECQDFCLKPLAAANRQFSNHPGDLSQGLGQMETIQLFAEKNNNNN